MIHHNTDEAMDIGLAELAATNGYRFDIGMSKEDKREYERQVRNGEMKKGKLLWPWLMHGTRLRTVYVEASSPDAETLDAPPPHPRDH